MTSERAEGATEIVSEAPESLHVERAVPSAGVLEPNVVIRQPVVRSENSCSVVSSPVSECVVV